MTADVVLSEGGKETYKNVRVNGIPAKESEFESPGLWLSYSQTASGAWSTGEYSSVLQDVLSPATDADFHNRRSKPTIVSRTAYRYEVSDQAVRTRTGTFFPRVLRERICRMLSTPSISFNPSPAYEPSKPTPTGRSTAAPSGSIRKTPVCSALSWARGTCPKGLRTRYSGISGRLRLRVNRRQQVSAAGSFRSRWLALRGTSQYNRNVTEFPEL